MNRILAALLLLFLLSTSFAGERDKSEIVNVRETDAEMTAAILHANHSLDVFLERFKNQLGGDSDFALKVMVSNENGVEHFWVTDISQTEEGFEGFIANEPKIVKVVHFGQKIDFGPDIVTDWSFDHNGVKQGAFTLRVLLKRMPKEWADYYRKAVGWN